MLQIICIIPSSCSLTSLPYLRRCLVSLSKAKIKGVKLYIYLVTDKPEAREELLDVSLDNFLLVDKKTGFAERNNVAIFESLQFHDPDYFLFINDDASVAKGFFKKLPDVLKREKPDLLNPLIYEGESSIIDSFGVEYFTSGYAKNINFVHVRHQLATAACLLVKTAFLKEMKRRYGFYFNPLYHYYLEDVEFSIRARALGGKIARSKELVAHHQGSATSGKKSEFVMFYTYRNLLWTVILTWPFTTFIRHILSFTLVQAWVFYYSCSMFGPMMYFKVWLITLQTLPELIKRRGQIISRYKRGFNFESLFSEFAFRTYHGKTIKV